MVERVELKDGNIVVYQTQQVVADTIDYHSCVSERDSIVSILSGWDDYCLKLKSNQQSRLDYLNSILVQVPTP